MALSRQFRALARLTLFFAAVWAVIGTIVALVGRGDETPLVGRITANLIAYGSVGAISGIVTGLLIARAESGRQTDQISTRRIAIWGLIGGAAPSLIFGGLAIVFGAPAGSFLPLIGLGLLSAAIGTGVAASASAVSRRPTLDAKPDDRTFPRR